MHPRFYAPSIRPDSKLGALPPCEAEHLVRVLRLGAGAEIGVFDGRGGEYRARVESVGRREVLVRAIEVLPAAPEPAVSLTLAQSLLKNGPMDDVVRDAVMMGISKLQPIISERTSRPAGRLDCARLSERWRRIAVSSAKQCGRAVVPEIAVPVRLADYLGCPKPDDSLGLVLVEPGCAADTERLSDVVPPGIRPASASILIGPEGGWTEEELSAATGAGFRPVTLGCRTMRADATPVVIISLLQFLWGDL